MRRHESADDLGHGAHLHWPRGGRQGVVHNSVYPLAYLNLLSGRDPEQPLFEVYVYP